MSIQLTGTGGIFTRWGKLLGNLNQINTFRSTTLDATVSSILAQYLSNEQSVVTGLISDAASNYSANSQWVNALSTDAQNTIIDQANRDVILASPTLTNALQLLISQMTASGNSCNAPTLTTTVTPGASNYGSAKMGVTLLDTDGGNCNFVFPETLTATVTSSSGFGATAYAEPLQVVGQASVQPLEADWPQGSGANVVLNIVNGATNGILTDSNFSNWTLMTPDNWTVSVGTLGTTIVKGTTPVRGNFDMQFVGNGSQLTSIYQAITSALSPNTIYGVSFWAKRSTGAAAGVLRVRLADGSNTTITDDAGNSCSTSVTVSSGLTTSYQNFIVFFVTPKILPTTVRFFIELTTAVTNAETVDISLVGMVAATKLYTAGPSVACFSGETASVINDNFSIAVTNNGGTTKFIPALNRFLALTSLGLKIPTSAASYTIPDNLITI